jgi:hypothetical protein
MSCEAREIALTPPAVRGSGRLRRLLLAVLLATLATALWSGGAQAATPQEKKLQRTLLQVKKSSHEFAGLLNSGGSDPGALLAAGERLATAAAKAKNTMKAYAAAKRRFGTRDELLLAREIGQRLEEASASYEKLAGPAPPVPSEEEQTETLAQFAKGQFRAQLAARIEQKLKAEGLADVLNSRSFKEAQRKIRADFDRRIKERAQQELQKLIGIGLVLDRPLKVQVRERVEDAAARWLGKLVFKSSPQSFIIQFATKKIVRWAGKTLKRALRNKGDHLARVKTTENGFKKFKRQLNGLSGDAQLDVVRRTVESARAALKKTKFLKRDLNRVNNATLLNRLAQAERKLTRTIKLTEFRFAVDKPLAQAQLGEVVAAFCELEAGVKALNDKLGPAGFWTGKWDTSYGIMTLTQSGNSVSGPYTHEGGSITNGAVTGNTVHATWTETENLHADPAFDTGSIWFTLAADGNSFTGSWNYSSDAEGSSRGAWNGTRIP